MRLRYWLLGAFLAFLALVVFVPGVSATCVNSAQPNANVCKGFSMVGTTVGGTASGRCIAVHTDGAGTLACSTAGVGSTTATLTWQVDPGSCWTLRYDDVTNGALPPAAPNKVSLDVRGSNSGTVIKTFLTNAAEPANGSTYTFCPTSDGNSGSAARAGTYRIRLVAIKDNGPGGVGNYNIDSDGSGSPQSFNKGSLMGRMLVSALGQSAYPAGSTFAYGAAGDETITVDSTFTTPNVDHVNQETMRTGILDDATLGTYGAVGATVDVDSNTLSQGYVSDNTFTLAGNPWVPILNIVGNDALTGSRWTHFASTGHGSGISFVVDTTVKKTSTFNIDWQIKLDSTASGGYASADETDRSFVGGSCSGTQVELFNRGESACTDWALVNARSEYLSRSMTFARHDASHNVCASYGSLTPTSNVYTNSGTFNTGGSCAAAADTTGSTRHLSVTNTDQSYESGTIYRISSLYFTDSHIQVASTLVPDDYPTDDAGEYFTYLVQGDGMGGDMSDTVRQWCKVEGVRHDVNIDTSGSAVTRTIKDPTTATRASGTTDTGSDGWTPSSLNLLATSPLGTTWTAKCDVSFNGNTASDTESFTIEVPAGGGGDTFQADPLKAFAAYNPSSDKVRVAISAAYMDGTARTGAAADLYVDAWNEALTQVVTAQHPIELPGTAYGVYYYNFTPATDGIFTVRVRTVDPDTMEAITVGNDLLVSQPATFSFNGTTENATLALLLDKLGPQGDPVNIEYATLDFWLPVVLWLVAMVVFLKLGKLMAAGAATAGVGLALATQSDLGWMALALILLVLALWLEATLMESVYQRWFGGRVGRKEAN